MAALRRWLFAALLVLAPLGITLWVLQWIIGTLDQSLLILPLPLAALVLQRRLLPMAWGGSLLLTGLALTLAAMGRWLVAA